LCLRLDGDTDMLEMGESAYYFAEESPQANANGVNVAPMRDNILNDDNI
ncbi:29683_t:CDS:1, partial [Racocetra persica]